MMHKIQIAALSHLLIAQIHLEKRNYNLARQELIIVSRLISKYPDLRVEVPDNILETLCNNLRY